MKKLKDSIRFIGEQLSRSLKRFPVTLIVTAGFVITAITLAHADYDAANREQLERMLFALAVGIPLTAALTLVVERLGLTGVKRYGLFGVGVLATVGYYFTIPEDYNQYFVMRFLALWAMLFFGFLMAPYFHKREGLSRYTLHLVGRFFLTVLFSGVIMGGLSMMVFTIEELFNVNWWDEVYLDLFLVIAGAFSVTHFLGSVPEINVEVKVEDYSKIFKSLFLYIIIPIVSVYTVILYAYFVKILMGFKLPEGIIGNLVLWYALVSVVTLFFIRDLRDQVKWLDRFYKWYIPAMIVPLAMLFLAIFVRIDAYGITMPRYFVVALAMFSTLGLAIMRFKKGDTAIALMILLVIFIAVSFYGGLSGYSLTLWDQNTQLENLLKENSMLDESGNIIANPSLSGENQQQVSEKIEFLLRNYSVEEVAVLPEDFTRDNAKDTLGFELVYYWHNPNEDGNRIYYYAKEMSRMIDLKGADFMLSTSHYESLVQAGLSSGYTVSKESDDSLMTFYKDGAVVMTADIHEAAAGFYVDQTKPYVMTSADGSITLTLDFLSIEGKVVSGGDASNPADLEIEYFDVRILIELP